MLELNKVYMMDCVEGINLISDNSIDLVIIDPPYFRILKNEKWDRFNTYHDYISWSEKYLKLIIEKLRLSGTLLLYGCSRNFNILADLNRLLIDNGMYFVQEIIIDKGLKSVAGRTSDKIKMLPPVTENILVYRKDAKPFVKNLLKRKQKESGMTSKEIKVQLGFPVNGGGNWTKYCGNTEFPLLPTEEHWIKIQDILNIDVTYDSIREVYNSKMGLTNVWSDINFYIKNRKHPSQKPIELADRCIEIFSNENDLVCIPFAGSGSECVSAKKLGRNFIAYELEEEYIKIANDRLDEIG